MSLICILMLVLIWYEEGWKKILKILGLWFAGGLFISFVIIDIFTTGEDYIIKFFAELYFLLWGVGLAVYNLLKGYIQKFTEGKYNIIEKTKTVGIPIFGCIFILHLVFIPTGIKIVYSPEVSVLWAIIAAIIILLLVYLVIAGILLLLRKEIGRKLTVRGSAMSILITTFRIVIEIIDFGFFSTTKVTYNTLPFYIAPYLLYGLAIFYFTRPKVKEQFK